MKIKKILIFGAGAIGRGFIAPIFYKNRYEISFGLSLYSVGTSSRETNDA